MSKIKTPADLVSAEACYLVHRCLYIPSFLTGTRTLWGPFLRVLILFMRAPLLQPNHLLTPPHPPTQTFSP